MLDHAVNICSSRGCSSILCGCLIYVSSVCYSTVLFLFLNLTVPNSLVVRPKVLWGGEEGGSLFRSFCTSLSDRPRAWYSWKSVILADNASRDPLTTTTTFKAYAHLFSRASKPLNIPFPLSASIHHRAVSRSEGQGTPSSC